MMKNVYEFIKRYYWLFLVGGFINIIFGVLAFALDYEEQRFVFPAVCSLLFVIFLCCSLAFAIFYSYKTMHPHITKIRKQSSNFLKLSTWLAFSAVALLFVAESAKIISINYIADPSEFTASRIVRYILCLPLMGYFFVNGLPRKLKKKRLDVPKPLKYTFSVCAILWGISGVVAAYQYEKLDAMNMTKNWQIIIYLVITFFFLFEAKFEHLKPSNFPYVLSASVLFILVMSFSVSVVLAGAAGFIPTYISAGNNQYESFSAFENLVVFLIGLYAYARMHALGTTIKHVMDTTEGTFSSKFNKNPDTFATNEQDEKVADSENK